MSTNDILFLLTKLCIDINIDIISHFQVLVLFPIFRRVCCKHPSKIFVVTRFADFQSVPWWCDDVAVSCPRVSCSIAQVKKDHPLGRIYLKLEDTMIVYFFIRTGIQYSSTVVRIERPSKIQRIFLKKRYTFMPCSRIPSSFI